MLGCTLSKKASQTAILDTTTHLNPDLGRQLGSAHNTVEWQPKQCRIRTKVATGGSTAYGRWLPYKSAMYTSSMWHEGNERADQLAKQGTRSATTCENFRATEVWLQTRVRLQLIKDWADKHPENPNFPPATTFPKELRAYSPASLRVLFQLQTRSNPPQ